MQLNPKCFALATAIIWSMSLFLMTLISVPTGYASAFLDVMAGIYPGYSRTWLGSLVGLIYGFADGFIGGYVLIWLYNRLNKKAGSQP